MRSEWDQLEDEPKAAYSRFCIYLALGPDRSIEAAYKSTLTDAAKSGKKRQNNGQWEKDSVCYNWVARATSYDIDQAKTLAQETTRKLYAEMGHALDRIIEAGKTLQPGNWHDYLEGLLSLANYHPAPEINMGAEQAEASGNVTPFRGRQQSA